MIPDKCDCCGTKSWKDLNQMMHVSGVTKNGVYRTAWWCENCSDGWMECPPEFIDVNGRCSLCDKED